MLLGVEKYGFLRSRVNYTASVLSRPCRARLEFMKESERIHGHHLTYDEHDEITCDGVRDFKGISSDEAEELFKRARDKKDRNYFRGKYDHRFFIRYSSTQGKYFLERKGHEESLSKEKPKSRTIPLGDDFGEYSDYDDLNKAA